MQAALANPGGKSGRKVPCMLPGSSPGDSRNGRANSQVPGTLQFVGEQEAVRLSASQGGGGCAAPL